MFPTKSCRCLLGGSHSTVPVSSINSPVLSNLEVCGRPCYKKWVQVNGSCVSNWFFQMLETVQFDNFYLQTSTVRFISHPQWRGRRLKTQLQKRGNSCFSRYFSLKLTMYPGNTLSCNVVMTMMMIVILTQRNGDSKWLYAVKPFEIWKNSTSSARLKQAF